MVDRNVVIRLRGDIGDFQAKMLVASKSVTAAAGKMTGAEKEAVKFRRGLTDIGNAAGKVGLVAAAGIAVAVKAFADFDKAMSGVEAATHATKQEMESLRQLALKTGADTAFSAIEAADGIEQLAKAGVSTADIMGGALQGALDLAAAGTVEVGFAAETAATAMVQFGLSGEQVPHIADLLAAAAGKAQGEVSDMSMALKQSGLVANQMGLTLEETTGAFGAFASAGLLGSDAGTSFKTMLMRLLPQSKEAGDAMEAIGFSAFDAQGNMKSLTEIAGGLEKGLKKMTDEQRQATLASIFGQDAIRAATVLYEEGARGIDGWIDKVNDQGYAAETAAIKMDNLAGDLEKLKGALSTLFIEGGENGNSFLRDATQSAEGFVNTLSELPDWANKAVFSLAALTAVVGGTAFFGAKVIGGIASTKASLEALNLTAKQTAAISTGAKAGMVGMAIVAGGMFVDGMDDANLSARQLADGLNALAIGAESDVFKNLSGGVDSLTEALEKADGSGFWTHFLTENAFTSTSDEIEAIDESLASLAETDLSKARDAYQGISDDWVEAGHSVDELAAKFPQYQVALKSTADAEYAASTGARSYARALDETKGPADGASRGLSDIELAARRAAGEAEDLASAVGDLEAVLAGNQRARDYEQSLDDIADRLKERRDLVRDIKDAEAEVAGAKSESERESAADRVADLKEQLKDLALTLDNGEQAGRDWNAALEGIALNAQEAAQDLEGMDQTRYLNNARKDFIDLATQITGSRKKAVELAEELGLLHRKPVKPDIKVDTKDAEADVRRFYRMLEGLKPVTVELFVKTVMGKNDIGDGSLNPGQVPRRGFASGGYTGNYPAQDVAGVVHGREFVFDADLTARYRGLFESIHRERKVPGYREGGYVAAQSSTTNYYGGGGGEVRLSDGDISRLATAVSKGRPIYGPVTVTGDGSFQRTLEQDMRREAVGGVNFRG